MEFTITVEWKREDGSTASVEVARIESRACQSAADVGLRLDDVKPLLSTLQQVVDNSSGTVTQFVAARLVPRIAT